MEAAGEQELDDEESDDDTGETSEQEEVTNEGNDDNGVAKAKIQTTDSSEGEEEEEEDLEGKPATESLSTVVFENAAYRIGDEGDNIRKHVLNMLTMLNHHEQLTEKGQALLAHLRETDTKDFELTADMFSDHAAEVLARHYDTWIAAAFHDGEANLVSLSTLLGY